MMNRMKWISIPLLSLFCILLFAGEITAQSAGFAGSFSRIGFAPRGMAMGNAFTAVHQEGSFGYYNPALTARPGDKISLDFSSAALAFDRRLHMVNTHFQLPPSAGISVALINASVSDIDGRSQSGFSTETLSTNQYQLLSSFGIRFSNTFWGGIGIKFNISDFHDEVSSNTSIGVDAGFYKQLGTLGLGLAVQDLFGSTQYDTSELFGVNVGGGRSNSFPTRVKFGSSYIPSSIPKLLVSAEYEVQVLDSEIRRESTELVEGQPRTVISREEVTTNSQFVRFGTRYSVHPRVSLRAGVQGLDLNHDVNIQPSAGFSVHLPLDRFTPSVDYAYVREPSNITTMHVFSIRLQL